MMMQCSKYKGKEFLKMYLTWTESESKELTRLGEKHGKTLPDITKHPNDYVTEHPGKRVTSTSLKSQDITLPPPRPIHQKDEVVVELNNDGDFSLIHYQGTYDSKLGIPFLNLHFI
jgi:hypothetical protein